MNRTDRLLAIVLELQGRGHQRAEDLAATFETSKRTIYRDIQALCEAGVPVVSMPGSGYSLAEGYFLPPLRFSADEGAMLLLGSEFMAKNFDADYRLAAQSASRKIAGVLPERLREDIATLQHSIRFIVLGTLNDDQDAERLQLLRRAILKHLTVRFAYQARHGEVPEIRDVDPYALIHVNDSWMLVGYCHLRQDIRNFRLSRMNQLTILNQTFTRTKGFNMDAYLEKQRSIPMDEGFLVRVLFDHTVARLVKEAYLFFVINQEETTDGLLITFRIRDERGIMQWLLGWGRHIKILEPDSLRHTLAQETEAMLRNFQP